MTHGVTYILTARFSQDCLENVFSQICGLGVFYNNPTPFEVCNRIRLLLLTGSTDDILLSGSASVAEESSIHSAKVMEAEASNSDEDFMRFVTSKLCIDIVEHMSISTTPNSNGENAELLNTTDEPVFK